jgi:phosphate transport system protein
MDIEAADKKRCVIPHRHFVRCLHHLSPADQMTRVFEAELQDLARMVAEMGGLAERQITEAIEALTTRDISRACRVIAADTPIDVMQRTIEETAIDTIAQRQPVDKDLRQVVGILRIATELERIGDLAKNIGKRIVVIGGVDISRRSLRGVRHLADFVQAQCRDVLDSFAHGDVMMALDVWRRDEGADRLCTSLFRELLTDMTEDPAAVPSGIHLLFCTKNLERMGDHATNIAEVIHYMVTGRTLLGERPKADSTSMVSATAGGAGAMLPAHTAALLL